MGFFKEKIKALFYSIDAYSLVCTLVTSAAILYFVNPLAGISIDNWDRTFSTSVIADISISKRINNFYILLLLIIPLVIFLVLILYTKVIKKKPHYKKFYFTINVAMIFAIVVGYFYRFDHGSAIVCIVNDNMIIKMFLSFLCASLVISFIDKKDLLNKEELVSLFIVYSIGILSSNILLKISSNKSILIALIMSLIYVFIRTYDKVPKLIKSVLRQFIFFVMWLPAILRIVLEILYYLVEKGFFVYGYYKIIALTAIIYLVISLIICVVLRDKNYNFKKLGYVGAIASISLLAFFSVWYKYYVNTTHYAWHLYEYGNNIGAIETIKHGYLPIVDYFSAHALSDVWTRLLYILIHGDILGTYANPYAGLSTMLALFILYYIVKQIFDDEFSILFIFFFPLVVSSLKIYHLCFLSVVMLIVIYKKPSTKNFVLFWILTALSAFVIYDEGIGIGIGCIFSYIVYNAINKNKKNIQRFLFLGCIVALSLVVFYTVYCLCTGINPLNRALEWFALSAGSNSTWATDTIGDSSESNFLFAYFITPCIQILILIFMLISIFRNKDNKLSLIEIVAVTFSIASLLYIPRSLVYRNYFVHEGKDGVLLNYIHITVALTMLHIYRNRQRNDSLDLSELVGIGTFGLVAILEGLLVTSVIPSNNSIIYYQSLAASSDTYFTSEKNEIIGVDRIEMTDESIAIVDSFSTAFDTLLEEDQTFLDFANVTALYALTDRIKPFYVGQSPSLLTNLYTQQQYLKQIESYDVPLALVGTEEYNYIQQMISIPHNIRYYTIAEYIYNNYRPLVAFGDFAIWCDKNNYESYKQKAESLLDDPKYSLIDYGYDGTTVVYDGATTNYEFKPFHDFNLQFLPYIWANKDKYSAINDEKCSDLTKIGNNNWIFEGSQNVDRGSGNYVMLEVVNNTSDNTEITVLFKDSKNSKAIFSYQFTAIPGTNKYLIRVSNDYFWDVYNIDTLVISNDDDVSISSVSVLKEELSND